MAIAAVQETTGHANAASVSKAFASNVSVDSLVVIVGCKTATTSGGFASNACTKSAGTATLDSIVQDVQLTMDLGASAAFASVSIWSAKVTGAGSLTMQLTGVGTNPGVMIGLGEYSGSWDASRLETSSTGQNAANNTSADTGNGTSAGAALFIAGVASANSGAITITEDAAFTLLGENQGTDGESVIRRLVASGTTDSGSWTLSNNLGWAAALAVYKEAAASTGGRLVGGKLVGGLLVGRGPLH